MKKRLILRKDGVQIHLLVKVKLFQLTFLKKVIVELKESRQFTEFLLEDLEIIPKEKKKVESRDDKSQQESKPRQDNKPNQEDKLTPGR